MIIVLYIFVVKLNSGFAEQSLKFNVIETIFEPYFRDDDDNDECVFELQDNSVKTHSVERLTVFGENSSMR